MHHHATDQSHNAHGTQMVVERSITDTAPAYLSTHALPSSPGSQDGAFLSPMTPSQLDLSLSHKTP